MSARRGVETGATSRPTDIVQLLLQSGISHGDPEDRAAAAKALLLLVAMHTPHGVDRRTRVRWTASVLVGKLPTMRTLRTWRAMRREGRRLSLLAVARGWS